MSAMPTTMAAMAPASTAGAVAGDPGIAVNHSVVLSDALPGAGGFASVAAQALLNVQGPAMAAVVMLQPESPEQDAPTTDDVVEESMPDAMALLASFAPVWQPGTPVQAEGSAVPPPAQGLSMAVAGGALAGRMSLPGGQSAPEEEPVLVASVQSQVAVSAPVSGAHAARVLAGQSAARADVAVFTSHSAEAVALPVSPGPEGSVGVQLAGGPRMATSVAAPASTPSSQPLMQALAQRIQVQQTQGVEVATMRLDPPQWGSVEVRIQHDAGGVQVFIQASHAEVGRQLAGMAEGLRQELQARSNGEATVVVAQGRQSGGAAGQGGGARDGAQPWTMADEDEWIGQALQAWQPPA